MTENVSRVPLTIPLMPLGDLDSVSEDTSQPLGVFHLMDIWMVVCKRPLKSSCGHKIHLSTDRFRILYTQSFAVEFLDERQPEDGKKAEAQNCAC